MFTPHRRVFVVLSLEGFVTSTSLEGSVTSTLLLTLLDTIFSIRHCDFSVFHHAQFLSATQAAGQHGKRELSSFTPWFSGFSEISRFATPPSSSSAAPSQGQGRASSSTPAAAGGMLRLRRTPAGSGGRLLLPVMGSVNDEDEARVKRGCLL